jgi:transposase InsO family protein
LGLAKVSVELSKTARQRLRWFEFHERHGRNVSLTCRHFGMSRQTFYRWKARYNPLNLRSLEDRSRRPKRIRRPTAGPALVEAVIAMRRRWPRTGKYKLVVLLRREGIEVSASMVGRILGRAKARGYLREPVYTPYAARKRRFKRPYATRKPKDYSIELPGDLVQVDTLDLRPLPGVILKHFTARDMVSRWDVVQVRGRATAGTAAAFLDSIAHRMPCAVKAIQVDGGSEFKAEFEQACRHRGIRLFVLPPRSPKLNAHVERAQRTHREEFYELTNAETTVAAMNQALMDWESVYNHLRPHQSLGYQTPSQFLGIS